MPKLSYALLGAIAALALIGSAQAQPDPRAVARRPDAQAQPDPQVVTRQPDVQLVMPAAPPAPRYVVRATTLFANDETGRDWPGSDEIYAVFTLRPPDEVADAPDFYARTAVFGDFDTGERRSFPASQNCLTSAIATEHSGDNASAWDCHPLGDIGPLQFSVRLYEEDVGDDDLIGERTVQWSREELAAAQLEVGGGSEESIRIGGYTLTWRVERVS